jgi:hypothetical protein
MRVILSFTLAWFLYVQTGRILLYPEPHVEPPVLAKVYDRYDTGYSECQEDRDDWKLLGYEAECQTPDGENYDSWGPWKR